LAGKKILIITGEISGDFFGYQIANELLKLKNIEIHAVGGSNLQSLPIKIIYDMSGFSTIGFTSFIPYLGKIFNAKRIILKFLKENHYDLAIFIDNQGFNIPIARKFKKYGVKCIYYFPPIVSVWDRKNAKIIPKVFDRIICPFKNDHEMYIKNSGNSEFVGHPFLDSVKITKSLGEIKNELNIPEVNILIGLFPGSRKQEINSLLCPILQAAKILKNKLKNVSFILSCVNNDYLNIFYDLLTKIEVQGVNIVNRTDYNHIASCDVIIGASGSLSIEAALLKTKMVVLYKVSRITYFIGKILIKSRWISWPNIILEKEIFPELIQNNVKAGKIADEVFKMLGKNNTEMITDFQNFKEKLGQKGVVEKVTGIVLKELNMRI